jgi:spore coat polysaccharide biosynthesis protein SpsF (cytidylyltransferase family)
VLSRYIKASELYDCENLVRVTADCPLVDPGIIDSLISLHEYSQADYTSNVCPATFPVGFDAEVVKTSVLKKVDQLAERKSHREHVTLFIRENTQLFKVSNLVSGLKNDSIFAKARLTLDRKEDFKALECLFKNLNDSCLFSYYKVLEIIENHKEILEINSGIDRFEGLKISTKEENRKPAWE